MKFTTMVDIDLLDTPPEIATEGKAPYSVSSKQRAKVSWEVEFEMREWGIKSTIITVHDQLTSFEIERETDDYETELVTVNLANVEVDSTVRDSDSLSPQTLQYYKGHWILIF